MKSLLKLSMLALSLSCVVGVSAQKEITVKVGDTVTLTSTNEGTKYEWSVSTDNVTYYVLPDEKGRTLTLRAHGENYYRVKWTDTENKSYYADTTKIVFPAFDSYARKDFALTAGQGYAEVDGKPGSGISIPQQGTINGDDWKLGVTEKLTNWSNRNAHAAYFINTPAGRVTLKMNITVKKNSTMRFRMRVYDTDVPDSLIAENIICFNGKGTSQTIPVITFDLGKKGYHKYDLECLWGNTSITSLNKWLVDLEGSDEPFHSTRKMAPSLHIFGWSSTNPKCPTGQSFDWAYEEVMIPGGDSIVDATYIMSLGVLAGYMGIQVGNNGTHRTVLFSQWDSGDTDIDPNLPDHLRSTAVDIGEGVVAQRFGAEGTGVQSFLSNGAYWEFGKYVQFISHCRNELATYEIKENGQTVTKQQRNMLVSAWFNAQDEKGWQYISTLRVANRNGYIDSWYSFVEDFSGAFGQRKHIGYFRNGFAKERSGNKKWYHMNKISFGHNNGGTHVGARNDIYQDVDPNDKYAWVMVSGGFFNGPHIGKQTVPLRSKATPVDTIDLDVLLAREELAFVREQVRLDSIKMIDKLKYDNTKWELISYTSEELSGEGTNGRAAQIIDGDKNTYWHSSWKSSTANPPHKFVIDMKEPVELNAFAFDLSGGKERFQKEILIEGSLDNEKWFDIYENKDCPTPQEGYKTGGYLLRMDSVVTARYLRLNIKKVHTGVAYARLNEFSVLNLPMTSIGEIADKAESASIYVKGNCVCVDAPAAAESATVDIYSLSGKKVVTRSITDIMAGDVISVHSFDLVPGVYTVRYATADGNVYSAKVKI